ncbi:hypothetical protein [Geitlerinema sp. PCC 9228]|uniref:hypothetical protein n=1 Tax=Geitlerinema sp. PCC 9228 TaxID=111611 RepID=UPI001114F697|nr:hypothetical protein [Geitlerinema sp. PCC 9228]
MVLNIKTISLLAVTSGTGVFLCFPSPAAAVTSFLGSNTGDFGIVDTDTGTFTSIGNTEPFFDIAVDNPTLGFGITGNGDLYSINLEDASTNLIGNTGLFLNVLNGLGFDDSGNLFATGGSGFYRIDLETGNAILVSNIDGFISSGDIAFDGTQFFATSANPTNNTLFSFNSDGSNQTQIGAIGFPNVFGLTYQEENLFGFTSNGEILSIDTTTGTGTNINTIAGVRGQIFGAAPQAVPGPATVLGSFVAGVLGIAFTRKRREYLT